MVVNAVDSELLLLNRQILNFMNICESKTIMQSIACCNHNRSKISHVVKIKINTRTSVV